MKEALIPSSTKWSNCNKIRNTQAHRLRLRNQTNHISFRLHAVPGTTCPELCGSLMPPLSRDPCSPMTNNASLPTLFSLELSDETEKPLSDCQEFYSDIMCKPTKAHAFTASTAMLGPNRTPPRTILTARPKWLPRPGKADERLPQSSQDSACFETALTSICAAAQGVPCSCGTARPPVPSALPHIWGRR